MKKLIEILQTVLTIAIIIGITTVLYLYTSGYRLYKNNTNNIDFTKTGMINAKSIPESASVYLDGKLITATNDTMSGIEPGMHELKITRKGFSDWSKQVEVFAELVTDITAVLVSKSPDFEPLTNTGAKGPSVSPTLDKLAYFSNDTTDPGIWLIPLHGSGISLFKSNPTIAIEDTRFIKYSEGKSIQWSPDEKKLLIEGANNAFYLVDIEMNTAQTTSTPDLLKKTWAETILEKRESIVDKLKLAENIKALATSEKAYWSPDEKKFLYTVQNKDKLEYRVYNFEEPLPVGEKIETVVFTTNANDVQPKVTWYSDSYHLILVEGNVAKDNRGSISIVRIDGTNKTEIYNNTLYSDMVYSAPGGDKVIVLTSFRSGTQTDLYTVNIR